MYLPANVSGAIKRTTNEACHGTASLEAAADFSAGGNYLTAYKNFSSYLPLEEIHFG